MRYSIIKEFLKLTILDILYFPIFWYKKGLFFISKKLFINFKLSLKYSTLKSMIKNLFVPMYQDYTKSGKIISFFIRIVFIVLTSFYFLGYFILILSLIILWISILPLTIFFIFYV